MHLRHSKLFESGGESVKRNLFEQYGMQGKNKQNNEEQQLREHIKKLEQLLMQKNEKQMVDKQTQSQNQNVELLTELIKQKDKSIEQYEKQILSFKNMILQKNNQVKELLNKLERIDTIKQSQIIQVSQGLQTDFQKQMKSQSQQTEIDIGLLFGVKQIEVTKKSQIIQTESKYYSEIMMLNQDEMYKEVEQYKQILRQYDLENRELKQKLQKQTIKIEQECQTEIIEDYFTIKDSYKQLQNKFNQQIIEFNILKKQYDGILSDYYYQQSESRANEKKIKELIDEIETLKQEIFNKEQSISSTETVTSPKESQKSSKKKGINSKLKNSIPINFNPQNVDELILQQEENQKLLQKINDLKLQLFENQKNYKQLQEEYNIKEEQIKNKEQQIKDIQDNQNKILIELQQQQQKLEQLDKLELKLIQKDQEMITIQQKMASLNTDYFGLKVINQTLHQQLEKYKIRQQQSP